MKRKFFDLRGLITACLMCFALAAAAQTTITGTVLDETGEPLIGATVQEYPGADRCTFGTAVKAG